MEKIRGYGLVTKIYSVWHVVTTALLCDFVGNLRASAKIFTASYKTEDTLPCIFGNNCSVAVSFSSSLVPTPIPRRWCLSITDYKALSLSR